MSFFTCNLIRSVSFPNQCMHTGVLADVGGLGMLRHGCWSARTCWPVGPPARLPACLLVRVFVCSRVCGFMGLRVCVPADMWVGGFVCLYISISAYPICICILVVWLKQEKENIKTQRNIYIFRCSCFFFLLYLKGKIIGYFEIYIFRKILNGGKSPGLSP